MSTFMKFTLSFSPAWILKHKDDKPSPLNWFAAEIRNRYSVTKLYVRLSDCEGMIKASSIMDEDTLYYQLKKLIMRNYKIEKPKGVFLLQVIKYEQDEDKTAMEQIQNLLGASEIKALAMECSSMARLLVNDHVTMAFTRRTYLISIDDGYGLTTYLNLFANLLEELNLFEFSSEKKVIEIPLEASENNSNVDDVFSKVLIHLQSSVCKSLTVPPFTLYEYRKYAAIFLHKNNFFMETESWNVFLKRILIEQTNGKFYGMRAVQKILYEMLLLKQLYNANHNLKSHTIIHNQIASLITNDNLPAKSGFELLDDLIGMESLKKRVREIVVQVEAAMSNKSLEAPCFHMCFTGNPGTGKTTVARIIGEILREKGLLRNGNFYEHFARDLCGRYIGETEFKTTAICREAYGSVLLIDEAYSLYRGDDHTHDFGLEAINTLVSEMENHRNDMVIILAGYEDEMQIMMKGNAGLQSRIPFVIKFPDYTKDELIEIFMKMAGTSFQYDDSFVKAVLDYFYSLPDERINAKEFGNARFVRNLYERTWGKAAFRCSTNRLKFDTLTKEDFMAAITDQEFINTASAKKIIGF